MLNYDKSIRKNRLYVQPQVPSSKYLLMAVVLSHMSTVLSHFCLQEEELNFPLLSRAGFSDPLLMESGKKKKNHTLEKLE